MKKMLVLSIVLAMLLAMSGIVSADTDSGILPIIDDDGPISVVPSDELNTKINGIDALPPVKWVNATDLKAGYYSWWNFKGYKTGTLIGIPYHLVNQVGSSKLNVKLEDYGTHDDTYIVAAFDCLNDKLIAKKDLTSGQSSVTFDFSTNMPFLVIYVYLKNHTPETTTWDLKVTTTRYS